MIKSRKSQRSRSSYYINNGVDSMTIDSRKAADQSGLRQYHSIYRQSSINDKLIFQRKENYLNSHFNKRKQTLKQITKANHKIYYRINSQKSQYDQKKFLHFQRPSSRCSSKQSRVSSKSNKSSRISLQQKEKQIRVKESKNQITINSQSINQIKQRKLAQFVTIFNKERTKVSRENFQVRNCSLNMKLPKKNKTSFEMGNILHKIQEEISYCKPRKKII